jgi:ribosomal protein S18 acetylase RimI-like enzyme
VSTVRLRNATLDDAGALVELWDATGLAFQRGHVRQELEGVLARDPELVIVVEQAGSLVASVMGAYDGRRGWVNRLATHPDHRGRGLARRLLAELEARLLAKGCRKVNLLIEPANAEVVSYYRELGYEVDELIFMEKYLRHPRDD